MLTSVSILGDPYVAKLSPIDGAVVLGTSLPGGGANAKMALAAMTLDATGNVYLAGACRACPCLCICSVVMCESVDETKP